MFSTRKQEVIFGGKAKRQKRLEEHRREYRSGGHHQFDNRYNKKWESGRLEGTTWACECDSK